MQDLKFKQDVEQAGIAWNQFTLCFCQRAKQNSCLLRCFRFIVTKWPCGQTLTNFYFLYFRSNPLKTTATETKTDYQSTADKFEAIV